jgi:hypothetical protein
LALANLSASGASAHELPPGDAAALKEDSARGVQEALESPLAVLLRGVESRGAHGEVSGLLLRTADGAVLERIFWRFSVACKFRGEVGEMWSGDEVWGVGKSDSAIDAAKMKKRYDCKSIGLRRTAPACDV